MRGSRWSRFGSALVLVAILVGPPLVLGGLWGLPTAGRVRGLFEADLWRGAPDDALVGVVAVLGWLAWAWMVAALAIEAVALRRGRAPAGVGSVRRGLRPLLLAVMMRSVVAGGVVSMTGPGAAFAAHLPDTTIDSHASEARSDAAVGQGGLAAVRVVKHDTLWGIADRLLGSGMRWREIHDLSKDGVQAIRGKMTDPHLIFPGDIVLLPADAAVVDAPPELEEIAAVFGWDVANSTRAGVVDELSEPDASPTEAADSADAEGHGFAPAGGAVAAAGRGLVTSEPADLSVTEPTDDAVDYGAGAAVAARVGIPAGPSGFTDTEAVDRGDAVAYGGDEQQVEPEQVVDHWMTAGMFVRLAVGSVSVATMAALGAMMVRRRRLAAAERTVGEIPEPLRQELAEIEQAALEHLEEAGPLSEWLGYALGDLMARRPTGGVRVSLVEGSVRGLEVLLTQRCDMDWGPWQGVHGTAGSVLCLPPGVVPDSDSDMDGWEALPLLVGVGRHVAVNLEAAGVVAAVAADEGAGAAEAVRGLCRAVVSEVICRRGDCDVRVWMTEKAAAGLGECSRGDGVRVMPTTLIEDEVRVSWGDVSSWRSEAALAGQFNVDDDRKADPNIGGVLVVAAGDELDELIETTRLAQQCQHNLAMLVMGACETQTRLELSTPGGEMVVHPYGIRVAALYVNDSTGGAVASVANEPVRMVKRDPGAAPAPVPVSPVVVPESSTPGPVTGSNGSSQDRLGAQNGEVHRATAEGTRAKTASCPDGLGDTANVEDKRPVEPERTESLLEVAQPAGEPQGVSGGDVQAEPHLTDAVARVDEGVGDGVRRGQPVAADEIVAEAHLVGSGQDRAGHESVKGASSGGESDADGNLKPVGSNGSAGGGDSEALAEVARDGDEDGESTLYVEELSDSWRSPQLSQGTLRLSSDAVDALRACGDGELRWAVLTAGAVRMVAMTGQDAGCPVEGLDDAAALAGLLAAGGVSTMEEAQSRMRWGADVGVWDRAVEALRTAMGSDFVDDSSGIRLEATVTDLAFLESDVDASRYEAGMEFLRGEVFDHSEESGPVIWAYDALVEQARFVVADWCVHHGRRLLRAGQVGEAQRVVRAGLLSQPLDGALLEVDLECVFRQGGPQDAERRVAEHGRLGADNAQWARAALERVLAKYAPVVRA